MASLDMYLKLDGVDGESTDDKDHKGEIDIDVLELGRLNPGDAAAAAAAAARARARPCQDFHFTKYVDKALARRCSSACAIGQALHRRDAECAQGRRGASRSS